ncbi:MAG TPA: FkbM family methyltransferase [Gemmatales bacterium]|nr:FkbM family methyltransferase [Gemmatales bacterium]HMP59305.1 FkbM family methyltransferase [Gemmatales bacterium]
MKAWLRRLAQSTPFQPLWRGLTHLAVRGLRDGVPPEHFPSLMRDHRILLSKLGFGWGSHVEQSGESAALERARNAMVETPVLFDVGANQGSFTRLFLQHYPQARTYSFEPAAATFALLQKNLSDAPGARLFPFGLSSSAHSVPLYSDAAGSGLASVYQRQTQAGALEPRETIELRRLDDVCAAEQVDWIDYLKMDVEGHELEVLHGAEQMLGAGRVRCVQWEYGGCNLDSRALLKDFCDLLLPRYEVFIILPGGLVPVAAYDTDLENFLTTNFLAVQRR